MQYCDYQPRGFLLWMINNPKPSNSKIMLQLHLCQCQIQRQAETMWLLSASNEKAWTNSDTTGSVPQATRKAPLSGLGSFQSLAPPPMLKKQVCMGPKGKQGPSDIPQFVPKQLNGNVFPGVYTNYSFRFTYLWYARYWLRVNSSFETFFQSVIRL